MSHPEYQSVSFGIINRCEPYKFTPVHKSQQKATDKVHKIGWQFGEKILPS